MKTIGISDFKALVNECLENPSLFAGKTVVLWKARPGKDSMAYRVIKHCCIEYNRKNVTDQAWFSYSDMTFRTDEIADLRVFCDQQDMYGYKEHGILLNTGCFYPADQFDAWLKFINTHENDRGRLSDRWVLIACAQEGSYVLEESLFGGNCDIYSLQPSLDEWSGWVARYNSQAVMGPVLAYIKEKRSDVSLDVWQIVLDELDGALFHNKVESLKQISEHDYDMAVRGSLGLSYPDFPYKELWDFIQSF